MRKRLEWVEEQKLINKELPGAPIDLPLELPKEELKELKQLVKESKNKKIIKKKGKK